VDEWRVADRAERLERGSGEIRIVDIRVHAPDGTDATLACDAPAEIAITCVSRCAIDDVTLGIAIRPLGGRTVFATNTSLLGRRIVVRSAGEFVVRCRFHNLLAEGAYVMTTALHRGARHDLGCYHWLDPATEFSVRGNFAEAFQGAFKLKPVVAVEGTCASLLETPRDAA
jgi:hypothetical protein